MQHVRPVARFLFPGVDKKSPAQGERAGLVSTQTPRREPLRSKADCHGQFVLCRHGTPGWKRWSPRRNFARDVFAKPAMNTERGLMDFIIVRPQAETAVFHLN